MELTNWSAMGSPSSRVHGVTVVPQTLGRRKTELTPENPGAMDRGDTGHPWGMVHRPQQASAREQMGPSSLGPVALAVG